MNRYGDAEHAYREAIELQPQSGWYWSGLGRLLSRTNRDAEAESAYRKAIELQPESGWHWSRLGSVLSRTNRQAEAESAYRKATELQPESAWHWLRLGNFLSSYMRRHEEAEVAHRKAIEIDPQNAFAKNDLARLIRIQPARLEEAAEMFLDALRAEPNLNSSLVGLRECCHQLASDAKQAGAAERLTRQGLELLPNDVGLQAALAHALVTRGSWDEARPLIEQWARAESASLENIELSCSVVAAGRTNDVLKILKKAGADERMRPLYEALRRSH